MNKNRYFTFWGILKILIFQQYFVFSQDIASLAHPQQLPPTSHKQTSLKVVLNDFERRFKVYFTFESNLIRDKYVNADQRLTENLEENLRTILNPLNLRFTKVSNRFYTISQDVPEKKISLPISITPNSDNAKNTDLGSAKEEKSVIIINVSGRIVDESGNGIPAVNISEKNTKNGTVTDKNGTYALSVTNEKSVLAFSFVGYSSQEVLVGKRTIINVELQPDVKSLSEVIVVGYGEQKRKNVTSAIATVGQADIENRPTTNAYQALQGLASNVTIQQNSAEPGAIPVFNIRGIGSFSSNNEPLILVDGLNVGSQGFANINPNDIENISILKDASSAAIYGSQAGAGVVLVTTKKGSKDQKPTLRYSGMVGIQNPTTLARPVEGWEFMTLKNEALVNSGLAPQFSPDQIQTQLKNGSNPWQYQEQLRANAPQSKHDISVSGGGKNTNYLASFGYFNQESLLNNKYVQAADNEFYYKRYNARLGLNTEISDILKIGISTSYTKAYTRSTPYGMGNIMRDALRTPRIYPLVNDDGSFPTTASFSNNNLALLSLGGSRMLENDNITGTFDATLTPLSGLRFNMNISGNYFQYNQNTQIRAFSYNSPFPSDPPRNNQFTKESWKDYNTNIYFTGEYERSFGKHTAKIMAGYRSDFFSNFDYLSAYRFNTVSLNNDLFTQGGFELSNGNVIGTVDRYANYSNPQLAVLNSYFGRLNYNFDSKYLFEFTWRYDGSSKLSPQARWLFYPAVSAAWRMTNEDFMSGIRDNFGNIKLRLSHGKVGNSGIGGYLYVPRIQLVNGAYAFNNASATGANILPYNSELQWASVTSSNIGADFELLKNSLTLSVDYFRALNDGIYYSPVVPGTFGQSSPVQNFATVLNKGWEISANYNLKTGSVSHTFNLNVADNFNTIQKLGADNITEVDSRTILRENFPISSYFMYKNDGLFQNVEQIQAAAKQPFAQNGQPQPGDIKFVDKNGDGVIDAQDRFIMGNPFPRYTFGFTYRAAFKGFDLSFFLQGVGQRSQYLRGDAVEAFHNNEEHLYAQHKDRWTPTNPTATYPRLTATVAANSNNVTLSDYWLYDTQYLRLKNLQVGYSIPNKLLEKVKIKTARLYVSGQNLFTLVPKRFGNLGIDPEFTQFGNRLSFENYSAIAGRSYPNTKVFAVGIDVSF